jgi:hypothetical protein
LVEPPGMSWISRNQYWQCWPSQMDHMAMQSPSWNSRYCIYEGLIWGTAVPISRTCSCHGDEN